MGCQKETVSEPSNTANQEETEIEEVVEEAPPVEEEELAKEVAEEEAENEEAEEEAPEEEPVASPLEWQGDWIISAEPLMFGYLRIYEETDEAFRFDIRTNTESSKELKEKLAKKDGSVATFEDSETGCVLTFTMENERIQVKETEACEMPGVTVDFNHSFILPDTYVIDDETFVATIKEGKLSPDGFGIGNSIEAVEQELGEPEAHISPNGGLIRIYSDIGYGTEIEGDGTIGALMVVRPEERTPEEMKELLGEPVGEGISELDGFYYLYYTIDDKYKLYLNFDPEKKTLYRFSLGIL